MKKVNKDNSLEREQLPMYGVGPFYGITIITLTVIGIVLSNTNSLKFATYEVTKIPFLIVGSLIILYGGSVWYRAAFRIEQYVTKNKLCTDGVYRIVRNPCYSGVLLVCTGALVIANNLLLLILPFLYWGMMTILMKCTEEKWLFQLYGSEYVDYCKKVNRCIPWFKRK